MPYSVSVPSTLWMAIGLKVLTPGDSFDQPAFGVTADRGCRT